ncbi:MAG: acetylornithine/succinylornithine family transaminase [Actinomycetota bacterium]|nr:acetylornithine/succinylornithine family transaminase [Actinomycetota bacterium]
MNEDLKLREARYVMQTYRRAEVEFVRGEGALLFDADGKEYLDFLGGISVLSMGHSHPDLIAAGTAQAGELMHSSNLFYTAPMVDLAERLSASSLGGRVFFCNSGTEANECAIKIARKHAHARGIEAPRILSFENDFHGRSYGALSATPGLAASPDFGPMLPGFESVPFDDADALRAAAGADLAAILIEPIQGESGIWPLSDHTLTAAREVCDETGALLIFDEIQTGMGRTGSLWAFEQGPVRPDVLTSAKALGGGVAIGVCIGNEETGAVLTAGDHGSTFAAGPFASRSALAMLDLVDRPETLRRVRALGARLTAGLVDMDGVREVRGRGLMLGIGLEEGLVAGEIYTDLLDRGLVANAPRPDTIRLLPPFILSDEQADRAVTLIGETLAAARA